ncbi:MAG: nucleotidyltransferase domain-containing protein [Candidatus Pacearchaeota archaeon]|jgi:hypothetical protein
MIFKDFNEIIKESKKDKDILGLFLGGSRAKSEEFVKPDSDYDIYLIVKDSVAKKYKKDAEKHSDSKFEFIVKSMKEFKSEKIKDWERYSYRHVKVIIDKNKQIQKIVNKKAIIPKEERKKFISGHLDSYINYVLRSLKCHRDNNHLASILEAQRSIEPLLSIIFALDDGKSLPYYKYLEWELLNYPIKKLPLYGEHLLELIKNITVHGDIKSQQELFELIEMIFRKEGYGGVYESWKWKISWIRMYK